MFKSDEGILYYSANEIASILNEPKTIEEEEFCAKWNQHYQRSNDVYTNVGYVQSKLYRAVQLKLIRYIQFQKGSKNMVYKVFSLKDILYFLDNNDYKVSKVFSKIRNVQVVEIGEKI